MLLRTIVRCLPIVLAALTLTCGDRKLKNERRWFDAGFDTANVYLENADPKFSFLIVLKLDAAIRRDCSDKEEADAWRYAATKGAVAVDGAFFDFIQPDDWFFDGIAGRAWKAVHQKQTQLGAWSSAKSRIRDSLREAVVDSCVQACLLAHERFMKRWCDGEKEHVRKAAWEQYLIDRKFRD